MNYNIRRRKKEDCSSIMHVVSQAWNETYKGIVNEDYLNSLYDKEKENTQINLNNFNDDDNHQFVLEIDNNIVGFINVGLTDDEEYKNQGEIFALYIINKYKGYGFGRKLVAEGVKELERLGCHTMLIGCLEANPSNEFYKHIGGKFIKTRTFKLPNQELIENVYYFGIGKKLACDDRMHKCADYCHREYKKSVKDKTYSKEIPDFLKKINNN